MLINIPKVPCSGEQSLHVDIFWYFYLSAEVHLDSKQVISLKETGDHQLYVDIFLYILIKCHSSLLF